jgi:hypothetical protein
VGRVDGKRSWSRSVRAWLVVCVCLMNNDFRPGAGRVGAQQQAGKGKSSDAMQPQQQPTSNSTEGQVGTLYPYLTDLSERNLVGNKMMR